ncbi:MAG TPA: AAA family ATPase [Oligoflexia bacterium]|nr:AAA family ATPase [Oligoflexia bacterium]HMP26542.1 AAA family ATPase [Oligoflexia bacterium]
MSRKKKDNPEKDCRLQAHEERSATDHLDAALNHLNNDFRFDLLSQELNHSEDNEPKKQLPNDQNSRATPTAEEKNVISDGASLGIVNKQYSSDFKVDQPGFQYVGDPNQLSEKLAAVGYQCLHFFAVQISLVLNTPSTRIRALLLEGPSGCGKSFMAKSLAKISGAELLCLSCYKGMITQNLIEAPSTLALANAMAGKADSDANSLMNLGIISRAFLKSQTQPVILLIDELDKPDGSIDTFFLGPIQDARIWLESRSPIDANPDNLLIIFTKNYNRTIDEALLRRVHPIKMTYLDSTLERKILSPHCHPQIVANLVHIADRMRNSGGSYTFERPPAPEELLAAGLYLEHILRWNLAEFSFVGRSLWAMLAKSEHDRAVLEHMLRHHPDFIDPLITDPKAAPLHIIYAKLGRLLLDGIIDDPEKAKRERAWRELEYQ